MWVLWEISQQCGARLDELIGTSNCSLAEIRSVKPGPSSSCLLASSFLVRFLQNSFAISVAHHSSSRFQSKRPGATKSSSVSTLPTGVGLSQHHKSPGISAFAQAQDMYFVELPVKDLTSDEENAKTTARIPMALPHELICYLVVALSAVVGGIMCP